MIKPINARECSIPNFSPWLVGGSKCLTFKGPMQAFHDICRNYDAIKKECPFYGSVLGPVEFPMAFLFGISGDKKGILIEVITMNNPR